MGERYGLDPGDARKLFLDARGDVWRSELIEGEGELGWEAATLERVPSTAEKPRQQRRLISPAHLRMTAGGGGPLSSPPPPA